MTNRNAHCEFSDLLLRYELGALSNEERRSFEAHLLECDDCFAELERGSAAVAKMRERAPALRRVLHEAEEPQGVRLRDLTSRLRVWLRPQIAVPVLVGLLLVAVGVREWVLSPDPARLASFPAEEIATGTVRAGSAADPPAELVESGAGYFNLGRYDEAARFFRAALEHDPEHARAAYLLGLSLALAGESEEAIPHLEKASRLSPEQLKAFWVLANAYLVAGRDEDARAVLEGLVRADSVSGTYASRARELLGKLPR
jgi:tetratricopeptide (TPR) repeat protein